MKNYEENLIKGITSSKEAFCGPGIVQIDLTGFCNNRCVGCWVHSPFVKEPPKDKNVSLPFETARRLIEELADLGTEEIFLSGAGEPFLYSEIFEILELIKKNGMKCNIITNFSLIDEEKAERLIDLQVDLITASIWAGTVEAYLKVHPGKTEKDFYRLKESLKNLSSFKKAKNSSLPQLKIYNVICNQNCHEIGKMIDFAKDTGAEDIEFQVMDIIDGETSFLSLSKGQVKDLKRQFDGLGKRTDLFFQDIKSNKSAFSSLTVIREIAREFPGRFIKIPSGFSLKEIKLTDIDGENCVLRIMTCPKGIKPKPTEANPLYKIDENLFTFQFPSSICKECSLFGKSCRVDKDGKLSIKFLKILGFGSFMRRLNSDNIYDHSYDHKIIDEVPCYAGWTYSRVLSTGEVIPCCKAYRFSLGNLHKDNFSKIWFSRNYNIFREKAKNGNKKDKYFSLIDCYKCCDNLGMNLTAHEYAGGLSLSKDIIVVNADNFSSGNLNATTHNFGKGMVIDGGYNYGFAQYEVEFAQAGNYSLWSYYASAGSRPVVIFFDGVIFKKEGMNQITGDWDKRSLRWFKEGDLKIEKGSHILKIFSEGVIPHIKSFAFKSMPGRIFSFSDSEESSLSSLSEAFPEERTLKEHKLSKRIHMKRKAAKRFPLAKIRDNYLDILGVFNGRYAFKGPFHVQIDLTYKCNNNCIGCWCNSPLLEEKALSPKTKRQALPLGTVKDLLDELASLGTREIYYSGGGEPFMHPDIMEILEYSKRKGFICYVNTNFTLLDKEKIKKIISLGIEHLTVSTWAASPGIYTATHPNKTRETFCEIRDNLKFLNSLKVSMPYVKLYNVIFKINYHEIEKMIDFAKETNSESVEFAVIDIIPGKTDKLLLNDRQFREFWSYCQKIKSKLDKNGYLNGVKIFNFEQFLRKISCPEDFKKATYDRKIVDKMPCYVGWLFARIMPDGNVNSCLKSHRIPVGNLFKESFGQIWNGKKQIEFRKKTLVYKKDDPFFRLIGNDPDIQEAGCYKSCDDIGRNMFMHNKVRHIPWPAKIGLKLLSQVYSIRSFRQGQEKEIASNRASVKLQKEKNNYSLTIKGIRNGRKAFAGPEQVVIDLTNRCNSQCIGCWLYSPLLKKKDSFSQDWLRKELNTKTVKRLIDDLSDLGTRLIRFTGGGEPLMHPDIMELLEYVKKKNISSALTTNFSLVTQETAQKFIDLKLDELAVSLWAADEDVYSKTHPNASLGEFLRIRENLKFLCGRKDKAPFVTLCNVIGNFNYDQLFNMFKFALEIGSDGIYFTLIDTVNGKTDCLLLSGKEKRIVLGQAEMVNRMQQNLGGSKKIKLDYFDGFISRLCEGQISEGRYDRESVNKIPCYVGWIFSRILADGKVSPCCRGVNLPLGNINEQSFKEIWRSEKYNEFRYRAKYLSKSAPYFDKIGCEKMCDNLMHNEEMHKRINGR